MDKRKTRSNEEEAALLKELDELRLSHLQALQRRIDEMAAQGVRDERARAARLRKVRSTMPLLVTSVEAEVQAERDAFQRRRALALASRSDTASDLVMANVASTRQYKHIPAELARAHCEQCKAMELAALPDDVRELLADDKFDVPAPPAAKLPKRTSTFRVAADVLELPGGERVRAAKAARGETPGKGSRGARYAARALLGGAADSDSDRPAWVDTDAHGPGHYSVDGREFDMLEGLPEDKRQYSGRPGGDHGPHGAGGAAAAASDADSWGHPDGDADAKAEQEAEGAAAGDAATDTHAAPGDDGATPATADAADGAADRALAGSDIKAKDVVVDLSGGVAALQVGGGVTIPVRITGLAPPSTTSVTAGDDAAATRPQGRAQAQAPAARAAPKGSTRGKKLADDVHRRPGDATMASTAQTTTATTTTGSALDNDPSGAQEAPVVAASYSSADSPYGQSVRRKPRPGAASPQGRHARAVAAKRAVAAAKAAADKATAQGQKVAPGDARILSGNSWRTTPPASPLEAPQSSTFGDSAPAKGQAKARRSPFVSLSAVAAASSAGKLSPRSLVRTLRKSASEKAVRRKPARGAKQQAKQRPRKNQLRDKVVGFGARPQKPARGPPAKWADVPTNKPLEAKPADARELELFMAARRSGGGYTRVGLSEFERIAVLNGFASAPAGGDTGATGGTSATGGTGATAATEQRPRTAASSAESEGDDDLISPEYRGLVKAERAVSMRWEADGARPPRPGGATWSVDGVPLSLGLPQPHERPRVPGL